jgi:hypothetical protein
MIHGSLPGRAIKFFLFQYAQTGHEAHSVSWSIGTTGVFLEVKFDSWCSIVLRLKVRGPLPPFPLYVFMEQA